MTVPRTVAASPEHSAAETVPQETSDVEHVREDHQGSTAQIVEHPPAAEAQDQAAAETDPPNGVTGSEGLPEEGARHNDDNQDTFGDGAMPRDQMGPPPANAEGEFPLTAVPLDTWVGRYVRITTARHNGTTGHVHRTGNGWVNLQTPQGDIAKRAYDLVVITEEQHKQAKSAAAVLPERTDTRGRRGNNRGAGSRGAASTASNSGSGEDKKPARSRSRRAVSGGVSSSDSSDQDDDFDDGGDEADKPRARRRTRAPSDAAYEMGGGDEPDNDDENDENEDENNAGEGRLRASGRPKQSSRSSRAVKVSAKDRGDRATVDDASKESARFGGRSVGKMVPRDIGSDKVKGRGRISDNDRVSERERGRERNETGRAAGSRERETMKANNLMSLAASRGYIKSGDRETDSAAYRVRRREASATLATLAEADEHLSSTTTVARDRPERVLNKNSYNNGKKIEPKRSWEQQAARAKERPNPRQWAKHLEKICRDSNEDPEDTVLSVELMNTRCDVCYHEKADGDKFCWNERCWMSPVFFAFFSAGASNGFSSDDEFASPQPATVNTFGRETVVDPALTCTLQAPVKWIEAKKRKLEGGEVFSMDPALYRWQCWASNFKDPTSKDPTHVAHARNRPDSKRARLAVSASKISTDRLRPYPRASDDGDSYKNGGGDKHSSAKHAAALPLKRELPAQVSERGRGEGNQKSSAAAPGGMRAGETSHKPLMGFSSGSNQRTSGYLNRQGMDGSSMSIHEDGNMPGVASERRWL